MTRRTLTDVEDPNPSKLAAMGILAGCVICAGLLLVFSLGSGSSTPVSTSSAADSQKEASTAIRTDEAVGAAQGNKAGSSEQSKTRGISLKSKDKKRDAKVTSSKYKNAYVESVPGKAPRMIEVQ